MANPLDSYLSGSNIEFIEGLYAQYLRDPSSIDSSWHDIFKTVNGHGRPLYNGMNGNGAPAMLPANGHGHAAAELLRVARTEPPPPPPKGRAASPAMGLQARVDQAVYAFRLRGHLLAELDPLRRPRPPVQHVVDLGMTDPRHFNEDDLEQEVDSSEVYPQQYVRLKDLLRRLRRTYCEHIGTEYMHLLDGDRRRWLRNVMEHTENHPDFSRSEQRRILLKLSEAEVFESFLQNKYLGKKRFSLDGADSLLPMMDVFLEEGGRLGIQDVVIGMAHRGRLNVLANILGKSADQIFSEFEGPDDPTAYLNRGDVKYHQGFSSDHVTQRGAKIHLSLAFNPSHLEAVDPVVVGRMRAKQDRIADTERVRGCALLIHGDAAFSGQGLVAETLNLSQIPGYRTGGTIHIVINNQVGFTTEPEQGRSGMYCTSMAHILNIPIFHVNGDDAEACANVMKLAVQYRQRFHTDVVIDLVCFRRYGHNEGDEPAYTQPQMYELIRKPHPAVRQIYGEQLIQQGRIPAEEAEAIRQKCLSSLQEAHARVQEATNIQGPSFLQGLWKHHMGGLDKDVPRVDTGVPRAQLVDHLKKLAAVPAGFTPHPNIQKSVLNRRLSMADGKEPVEWGAAELLAYATLLTDGYPLRLTGQDTERGTFGHRNAILHDVKTGASYPSLSHLSEDQAEAVVLNSPLSEMGCLGFEYGFSLDFPDGLVVWEAQFGDFTNNAQVIIDQFIAAAENKWRRLSGLTLLLPHGYEGMGPEHSSARLERFLELCAEDNLQVCYPTTSAQIFHLLRRQVLRPWRKPLIIMSPKSLLRRDEAKSTLEDLEKGRFQRVITDRPEVKPEGTKRLLLCSGKVYYDLVAARDAAKDFSIAVVRLEQLYPYPKDELDLLLGKLKNLEEIFWVQEEPKNMGAWRFMFPRLHDRAATLPKVPMIGFVGRAESGSPATGFQEAHEMEQQLIVGEALNRGVKHGR